MNLQDFSDKVGDIRNRVSDKMDEYAEDLEQFEEERGETPPAAFVRLYGPELKKAAYILGVFLAASYGARYGVNLAIKAGRLKVKKH